MFRTKCREWAEKAFDRIVEKMEADDLTYPQLLETFVVLADRGGYLPGDKLAAAEAARWRVQLGVLALQVLTPDQRDALLKAWHAHEREVLAEDDQAAA
jgi:hypothetical protein